MSTATSNQSTQTNRPCGDNSPVAFITGSAADRVGRRIARRFLDAGYRVVFHSHRGDDAAKEFIDLLRNQGHTVKLCTGAIEIQQNVVSWLDEVLSQWQRIDVLVNSAAIWDPKPLEQVTPDDLQRNFEVNTMGTFLTSQHFGLAMVSQPSGGAIIQIGDWACIRPYADFAAYFVGKSAIETMTRSLAVELALRNPNIRVNAVLPGPVLLAPGIGQQAQQAIIQQSLLKRAGTAEDVSEAVYFLATSSFITGVCLPVDGGRSIYAGPGTDPAAHPKIAATAR